MSGTIQSARKAAESADIPVHVYDSRTNSMGLAGRFWQRPCPGKRRVRRKPCSKQPTKRASIWCTDYAQHAGLPFQGRPLGGAISFVGNLLNIKPAISVNLNTGAVEAGLPTRTRRRAIDSIFENFFKKLDTSRPMHVAVLHNNAYAEASSCWIASGRISIPLNCSPPSSLPFWAFTPGQALWRFADTANNPPSIKKPAVHTSHCRFFSSFTLYLAASSSAAAMSSAIILRFALFNKEAGASLQNMKKSPYSFESKFTPANFIG